MSSKTMKIPGRGSQSAILMILDPLDKLDPETDTSLALAREFLQRGYSVRAADVQDLFLERSDLRVRSAPLALKNNSLISGKPSQHSVRFFKLIVIRKEPPFDESYLAMTYMLSTSFCQGCFISNSPHGIRSTNEKMSIHLFPELIPPTLTCSNHLEILSFQRRLRSDLVIKPLGEKGGKGIFRLRRASLGGKEALRRATRFGRKTLQAQVFIGSRNSASEKRVLLLEGELLGVFEKRARPGEFRANLSLGATIHRTRLTKKEVSLIKEVGSYSKQAGLHLVGIDVLHEKLIEINVTCPSGLLDLKLLYPSTEPVRAWADSLVRSAGLEHPDYR